MDLYSNISCMLSFVGQILVPGAVARMSHSKDDPAHGQRLDALAYTTCNTVGEEEIFLCRKGSQP